MDYRPLGNTGLTVSRLCFGALTLGPCQNDLTPEEGGRLIARAVERGVNFIDTAQLYRTYPHIREGIKGTGQDIVIASKTYAYEKTAAREAVDEARRALGRDVIDIFLLHEQESIHTLRGHTPALEELYRLKAVGAVRAVGCSTHRVAGVRGAIEQGLDVVQALVNLTGLGIMDGSRADMESACADARAAGLGVYGMKVLGGGNLLRRAEEALSYALALPCLDSIAVGMGTLGQIEADVAFFERGHFPSSSFDQSLPGKRLLIEEWCTGCGECAEACRSRAIKIKSGKAMCRSELCLLCGYCSQYCREFCVKIVDK